MGLFSNNKKLCPICGGPTPRLFPTKIEEIPLCKSCAAKMDLPDGALEQMSLENFRRYMAFYDENQPLREAFTENYRYNFGFLSNDLLLDTAHGLFRLKNLDTALVFPASCLKGFSIREDKKPLYENGAGALHTYASDVSARVNAMGPQIDRFLQQRREFEHMEQMERMRAEHERACGRTGGNPPPAYHPPRPSFDMPEPFHSFCVELRMEHPYWHGFSAQISGPTFDNDYPSMDAYLSEYQESTEALHTLAANLMQLMNPAAGEIRVNAKVADAAPASVAAEDAAGAIRKYKTLLDTGAITQEEFTAKKRQLLAI